MPTTTTVAKTTAYTLTLSMHLLVDADLPAVHDALNATLEQHGVIRTGTVGERPATPGAIATAGVSWRSTDDATAAALALALTDAARNATGITLRDVRVHTGYGIHTRIIDLTPRGTITKTIGRDLPDGSYLEVTAELRQDDPRLSDGFSVVGSLWEPRSNAGGRARARMGRDCDLGGQITEVIAKHAPKLAPLLHAHLAAPDGTPMHAEANGWYFYTGKAEEYELKHYGQAFIDRAGTPLERAARALHIPVDKLPEGMDREEFSEFVANLQTTWATHADDAVRALNAMIDGDGVEDRSGN